MVHDAEDGAAGAGLGVLRAVHKPRDAGVQDGSGTHRAGFKRDVKRTAGHQAVVLDVASGVAEGDDLGVRGRVVIADDPILAAGDDLAVVDEDRSDWDLARGLGFARLGDCRLQKVDVGLRGHGPRSRILWWIKHQRVLVVSAGGGFGMSLPRWYTAEMSRVFRISVSGSAESTMRSAE